MVKTDFQFMEAQMATSVFLISYIIYVILLSANFPPYLIPVWLILSYFLGFITVLVIYVLHLPIVVSLPSTNKYKFFLMKSLAKFINRYVIRLKITVDGLEHIPKKGKLIIYANHKSYSDGFALLDILTRPMTFTPKKSVMSIPIVGLWLKSYDVFPINRKNPRETLIDLEAAIETVKKELVISIFPEGTIKYREDPLVQEMKPGAFRLAQKAESDILVVRFDGNQLTKHRTPFRSTKRHITIFPVVHFKEIEGKSTQDIAKLVMDTINSKNNNNV